LRAFVYALLNRSKWSARRAGSGRESLLSDRRSSSLERLSHVAALTQSRRCTDQDLTPVSEISTFTNHVVADQGVEISRMSTLLAELGG
jgi:peroxiredoxin